MNAISSNRPSTTPNVADALPPYPSGDAFGALLSWHVLTNGTRPDGSPHKHGRPWRRADFALAVGRGPRAIGNWFANQNVPHNIDRVFEALFGDNDEYDEWRLELQVAASLLQQVTNRSATSIVSRNQRSTTMINVPAQTFNFSARDEELETLKSLLIDKRPLKTNAVAIVHAFPGVGKTSLGVAFCHIYSASFEGIYWFSAESREGLVLQLAQFSHPSADSTGSTNALFVAKQTLAELATRHQRWLLVYDNADSPKTISDLLPQKNASVLITSTFSDWSDVGPTIPLSVFSDGDSALLLNYIAKRDDKRGADLLAKALGGLPLALNHAALTCRRCSLDFENYANDIEQYLNIAPEAADYAPHTYAALERAIGVRNSENNQDQSIIFFLSFCAAQPIPMALVSKLFDQKKYARSSMLSLIERSLISISTNHRNEQEVSLHRLVQSVGRSIAVDLGVDAEFQRILCKSLLQLVSEAGELNAKAVTSLSPLIPHVIAIKDSCGDNLNANQDFAKLLFFVGDYLNYFGFTLEAEEVLKVCCEVCENSICHTDGEFDFLNRKWSDFVHSECKSLFLDSEYFETQKGALDVYESAVIARLRNRDEFIIPSDRDIVEQCNKLLSLCVLRYGISSQKTINLFCISVPFLERLDEHEEAQIRIERVRQIFSYPPNLAKFLKHEYSFENLLIFVSDSAHLWQLLGLRLSYLMSQEDIEDLKVAELLGDIGDIQKDHYPIRAFRSYKSAFQLYKCNGLEHSRHALEILSKVGVVLIKIGKEKIGQSIFDRSLNLIEERFGEDCFEYRKSYTNYILSLCELPEEAGFV